MKKEKEIVWTYEYYVFLTMPFFLSIFLLIQAHKEGHLGIFADMWWIMIIVLAISFYMRVWHRRTEIDRKNKTLTFFDGALSTHSINAGSLKEITATEGHLMFSAATLKYVNGESQKSCTWYLSFYPRESRKKIFNSLLGFNPDVNVSNEVRELIYSKEGLFT